MDVDAQAMAGLMTTRAIQSCPLCAAANHSVVSETDRHGAALRTVMCTTCGHVFTNPAPTEADLKTYYSERYRAEYKGVLVPKRKHVLRAGFRAIERLARLALVLPSPARVLDVGSGGGEFAYLLAKAGYSVTGLEPNKGYAAFAREAYGLDIHGTILELIDFESGAFDAITMHHVLEHVADPRQALIRMHAWLKPNGLAVIEVPNVMSWFHAPHRRFHAAHLHTFNQTGLEDVFRSAGFEVVDLTVMPGTAHLNIVARRGERAGQPTPTRSAVSAVQAHFHRHTELSHVMSGMALRRLWGNLKRPIREGVKLLTLGNPATARAVLDRLYGDT
jgi:2-polyprenyl-3-methyl-5-hydroxy-6-metoxy-1,4-benzoquinol methylase